MQIKIHKIDGAYNGKECFVHARMCALDERYYVMTMQKLYVHGIDLFSPLFVSVSKDGGKSWSEPKREDAFLLHEEGGAERVGCDATPFYHKKTRKAILTGAVASYGEDKDAAVNMGGNNTFYSVYDCEKERFSSIRFIDIPEEYSRYSCRAGCSQIIEEENGDLLIPVYFSEGSEDYYRTTVMRCSFDGENVRFREFGNTLELHNSRGLCEPSLCKYKGKYYLTLRNDEAAYFSVSEDGLHFSPPALWRWDTDEPLPSYNTQQHWLLCGGRMYLVYTRKAGSNDHVFRHRAPLFMAEVDTENMRIRRHTEQIVAPERGARLGNFGVCPVTDSHSVITASEWMQPVGCEKYGSDNSIFITDVTDTAAP